MLHLIVEVPETRDRAAIATLRDGFTRIMSNNAAASATEALAKDHGNPSCDPLRLWGHPPFGQYVLLNQQSNQPDLAREYGHHLLLFQPLSGPALEAEAFGRLALLAYGGPPGADRRVRRTQGGLRLTDNMINAIVARVKSNGELLLELKPLRPPRWWQFWKTPAVTQPLSRSLPGPVPTPLDEWSLLDALLKKSVRRVRSAPRDDTDDSFDRDSRHSRSSSRSDTPGETFQGKGGESGGGGASGRWDAPGRGNAPGVDSSGRIVGAVAAAAALGTIAGAAASSRDQDGVSSGAGDTSSVPADTGSSLGDAGSSSGDTGSATSDSSSGGDTSTGTSY